MSGELSLNVVSLADTIRDRVRATIASTIPDDQINGLIKNEYESFFEMPTKRYSSDPEPRSEFQRMVYAEISKVIEEKVREAVRLEVGRYANNQWTDQGKGIVERFVKEYAPVAVAGVAEAIVRDAMSKFQNGHSFR